MEGLIFILALDLNNLSFYENSCPNLLVVNFAAIIVLILCSLDSRQPDASYQRA